MSFEESPVGWTPEQYQLIDFGCGRKLERFGRIILDRPCPAAADASQVNPAVWRRADACVNARGKLSSGEIPEEWPISVGGIRLALRLTPFGHVGVFPEQADNWCWLDRYIRSRARAGLATRVLNLFAYTGASTLVMAAAGAQVVHIDASAPAVQWARRNARLSDLQGAAVRWIVEDARKFVQRELRRQSIYDLVVLDPPTFGHGPTGKRWQIEYDLDQLLQHCVSLLDDRRGAILLTAHCQSPNRQQLVASLSSYWRECQLKHGRLILRDPQGRRLDAGFHIRGWTTN